jgi:hypothetical protein
MNSTRKVGPSDISGLLSFGKSANLIKNTTYIARFQASAAK